MNTLNRAAFLALDPIAQMSHVRGGGTVINDEPVVDPFSDMPFIMDGKQRLAAIEARKKAIEFDAQTAAMRAAAE